MASMRVHELAKEFGMDSKVLLSRIQDLKIAAKSHASVLSEANVEKIREALAPELGAKAAAGMDAEAAAKAQAEKAAADEKKAEEERARRAAVERERELRAEERARREHNSAAKGEASAAAASAKQTKRPPAPAVNSGLSSLARQIEEQKAAAEHRRKKAAQDARAAKLAAEVAKKKAVAEALANRGAKKPAAKPAVERRPKPAPTAAPRKSSFDSLLSQIEAERTASPPRRQLVRLATATPLLAIRKMPKALVSVEATILSLTFLSFPTMAKIVTPKWPFRPRRCSATRCSPRRVPPLLPHRITRAKAVVRSVRKSARPLSASALPRRQWSVASIPA